MMDNTTQDRINIIIKKAYYTAERYKVDTTFAYLYSPHDFTFKELGSFLRMTDQFIQVENDYYFINFTHTNFNDAFKAAQNLLHHLDNFSQEKNSYIAIDSFTTSNSPKAVFQRLEQILEATKKHSYSRIEDESILNQAF